MEKKLDAREIEQTLEKMRETLAAFDEEIGRAHV